MKKDKKETQANIIIFIATLPFFVWAGWALILMIKTW